MSPRKIRYGDSYHVHERERMRRMRELVLTQNQKDALDYLKAGGLIAVKGKHVWYHGKETKYLLQRNTFVSLHKRGLLRLDHSDEEADYYTKREGE